MLTLCFNPKPRIHSIYCVLLNYSFIKINIVALEFHEKYDKYLNAIRAAEAEAQTLDATDCRKSCACFRDVIKSDLKPFKETGISKKLVEAAKPR